MVVELRKQALVASAAPSESSATTGVLRSASDHTKKHRRAMVKLLVVPEVQVQTSQREKNWAWTGGGRRSIYDSRYRCNRVGSGRGLGRR